MGGSHAAEAFVDSLQTVEPEGLRKVLLAVSYIKSPTPKKVNYNQNIATKLQKIFIQYKTMYKLYDFLPSGNSYKIRLLLNLLEIPFERVNVNILQGESRTPEFLQKNSNGKIPLLEITPNKFSG